jgi:hypothetical protein
MLDEERIKNNRHKIKIMIGYALVFSCFGKKNQAKKTNGDTIDGSN